MSARKTAFNSALEIGLRSVILLVEAYPKRLDMQRLLQFDYIALHSEDAGGPASLHPPLPMRSGELTVRRQLIERGLLLMLSRGLITRIPNAELGFVYEATDSALPFISNLSSPYILAFKEKATWAVGTFGGSSEDELADITAGFYKNRASEFDVIAGPRSIFEDDL
jgi:hypothetical protein